MPKIIVQQVNLHRSWVKWPSFSNWHKSVSTTLILSGFHVGANRDFCRGKGPKGRNIRLTTVLCGNPQKRAAGEKFLGQGAKILKIVEFFFHFRGRAPPWIRLCVFFIISTTYVWIFFCLFGAPLEVAPGALAPPCPPLATPLIACSTVCAIICRAQ